MKILFWLCYALLLPAGNPAWAQEVQSPSEQSNRPNKLEGIYLNLGTGKSLFPYGSAPLSLGLTAFSKRGLGGSISVHYTRFPSVNTPADYRGYIRSGASAAALPTDFVFLCSATALHKRYIHGMLRWGFEGGLAWVYSSKNRFLPAPTSIRHMSNYQEYGEIETTVGVHLAMNLAHLLSQRVGFETNLWSNINVICTQERYYIIRV